MPYSPIGAIGWIITIPMMIRFHSVSERFRRAPEIAFVSLLKKFSFLVKSYSSFGPSSRAFESTMVHKHGPVSGISFAQYSIVSMKQFGQIRPLPQPLKFFRHHAHQSQFSSWFFLHRSEEHTSELQSRSDLVCRL